MTGSCIKYLHTFAWGNGMARKEKRPRIELMKAGRNRLGYEVHVYLKRLLLNATRTAETN